MALAHRMPWLKSRSRAVFPLLSNRWIRLNRRWIVDGLRICGFRDVFNAAATANGFDQAQVNQDLKVPVSRIVNHVEAGATPAIGDGTFRLLPTFWKMATNIRTVQELLGHRNVTMTMIYAHVLNRGGRVVRSPADGLMSSLNLMQP